MRAEDLRLNNHMNFEIKGDLYTGGRITGIGKDHVYINTIKIPELEFLRPIPLTEEWLLKLGYRKQDYGNRGVFFYHDKLTSVNLRQGTDRYYTNLGMSPINSVQYVHELQNLIFAISAKELITNIVNLTE